MNQIEIKHIFEQINENRTAMLKGTGELMKQLEEPQLLIASIEAEISDVVAPYAEVIDALKTDIETAVFENAQSCKTDAGTCTFVKGRKGAIKWNDEALNGAIAGANGDLDFMLGFRTEKPDGPPSTRFKLIDLVTDE